MKKKLLVFHPALAPYRIDFFNFLAENFDASFYFSRDNLVTQKFDQEKLKSHCNFEINLLPHGFDIGVRVVRLGIIKIIRDFSPDIIICSEYGQITLAILGFKKLSGLKTKVYTIADDNIDMSTKRKGMRRWAQNWAAKNLDGIFLPTAEVANWFHKSVNENLPLIELPVAWLNSRFRTDLGSSLKEAGNVVIEKDLINKKIFLFVGRLTKVKNLELLLKSFADAGIDNKKLIIVGGGVLADQLQNISKDLELEKYILFTGRLEGEQLLPWYNIAEYFILPSYFEPFGAVVNEALLAGCKVICSKLAGAAELINQGNGILFDPYNQAELTRILEEAGKDMQGVQLPLKLRDDKMPFNLEDKFREIARSL